MKTRAELRAIVANAGNPAPVEREIEGLGVVFLKVQTVATAERNRAKLAALEKEHGDDALGTGRALAVVLCDAEGNYLYDIDSIEDVSALAALPPEVANAVFQAAGEVNRRRKEDVEGKGQTQSES